MEVVPMLGPIVGAVPAILVALSVGPEKVPWVIGAAVLIQQIENYLLLPRVMDKSLGVHPIVTLLAIVGFGSLFGVAGAIVAIPLAAVVQTFLDRFFLDREALQPAPPESRDAAGRLSYEAGELIGDVRAQFRRRGDADEQIDSLEEAIEALSFDLQQTLTACYPGENGALVQVARKECASNQP
jgi:hypothetical protein